MTTFIDLSDEWWTLYHKELISAKEQSRYYFSTSESLKQLLTTLSNSNEEEKIVRGLINQEFLKGRNELWHPYFAKVDADVENLKKEKFNAEYRLINGQLCTVFTAAPWINGTDYPSKYHNEHHSSRLINRLGWAVWPQIGFNVNCARNILYYDSHYHHALSLFTARLRGDLQDEQQKYQLTLHGEDDPRDFTLKLDDKNSLTFTKKLGDRPEGERGTTPLAVEVPVEPQCYLETLHVPGCLTNFDIFQYNIKNLIYLEYDGAFFISEFNEIPQKTQETQESLNPTSSSKEICDLIKQKKETQIDAVYEKGVDHNKNSEGQNVWREFLN